MKKQILILLLLITALTVQSQGSFNEFFTTSQKNNKIGMYVLGGWAAANLTTGAIGWSKTTGSTKYFHQMNFFWNTVNLGIAGFSFYSASQLTPMRMTPQELMNTHLMYEKLYLINAGLDIAYIGSGFLLKRLSTSNTKRPDQLKGYGNSLLLQGGFLFAFDAVMYFLQHNHRVQYLNDMKFSFLPDGIILQYSHHF